MTLLSLSEPLSLAPQGSTTQGRWWASSCHQQNQTTPTSRVVKRPFAGPGPPMCPTRMISVGGFGTCTTCRTISMHERDHQSAATVMYLPGTGTRQAQERNSTTLPQLLLHHNSRPFIVTLKISVIYSNCSHASLLVIISLLITSVSAIYGAGTGLENFHLPAKLFAFPRVYPNESIGSIREAPGLTANIDCLRRGSPGLVMNRGDGRQHARTASGNKQTAASQTRMKLPSSLQG